MSVKPGHSGGKDPAARPGGSKPPAVEPSPAPEPDLERELRRRERELEALHTIQDAVVHSLELKDVLNQALDAVMAFSGMEAGEILLWDADRQALDITAWRGLSPEYVEGMKGLKPGESVSGHVFQTGEPYVVEDATTDPRVTRGVSRRTSDFCASATLPLRVKDRVLGTLSVGVQTPRPFAPEEVRLLQTVADQVAVAIDNANLCEAQQKYARRLMRLTQATLPMLSIFPVETLYRRVVESAMELIKADLVALPMIEPDGRSFTYIEAVGLGADQLKGKTLPLNEGGLCGWVAAHSKPLLVPDVKADPRAMQDLAKALGLRSALVVPLTRGERTLGGLSAFRTRTAFTELDQQIFQLFANYATASLENARLFGRLERNTEEQVALLELSATFLQSGDPQAVAERAAYLSARLLQADACAVLFPEEGRLHLVPRAAVGYPPESGPLWFESGRGSQAGYAIEQDLPVMSLDLRTEKRFDVPPLVRQLGFVTGLAVPMRLTPKPRLAGEAEGALPRGAGALVVHTRSPRVYSDNDIHLLSLIANQVATAVQAAHLLKGKEEAQQNFRSLVESVPGVVWEIDPVTRRITYMSPQVESLTGRPAEYFIGRQEVWNELHPDDVARAQPVLDSIRETDFIPGVEFRIRHSDGHYVWIRGYGRLGRDEGGRATTLRGVLFDIAAEKQFEEERKRLERLRALGEIASGVAHDFNNALFAIVGYTELIAERITEPDLMRDLSALRRAATDASRIVRRMEAFYKTQAASFVPLDVNEVVTESLDISRPRWKIHPQVQGLRIEVVTHLHDLPTVQGDSSELREIFTNLIFNAVDAMPAGGTLTIESRQDGDKVVVSVKDTGIGMDEATQRRVFEAFYTTKGAKGSGLGLSLCNSIVGRHGGIIEVESAPGAGSTFTVILPVSREVLAAQAEAEAAPPGRPLTLLAVDDEPMARDILASMLARLGHTTIMCENGEDALKKFNPERFDAVITDLGMPAPNGFEVARRIKQIAPDMPVIMLTGWGDMLAREQLEHNYIAYLLKKPVMLSRLRAVLGEIGEAAGEKKRSS